MTTLYIDICPVKGSIDTEDMEWAVINAGRGLAYKHGISISLVGDVVVSLPKDSINGYRIEVSGNEDDMNKFLKSPGRRLRGISGYLLRYWPEKYRPLMVGTKMFNYNVVELVSRRNGI